MVLLMILGAIAELISLGAVVPFLTVLSNPAEVRFVDAFPFLGLSKFVSEFGSVTVFSTIFIILVILSAVVRLALLVAQVRLSNQIGVDLCVQMFDRSLRQDYQELSEHDSSSRVSAIMVKANQVVANAIHPLLTFCSSAIFLVVMFLALLALNPVALLAAFGGLALIYTLVILFLHKKLARNGLVVSEKTTTSMKVLQEALGGAREVILDQLQTLFVSRFKDSESKRRAAMASTQYMTQSPRYVVEAAGMILIALLAIYISGAEGGLVEAIPLLGALALGAQRILPLVQQLFSGWSNVCASAKLIDDVAYLYQLKIVGRRDQIRGKALALRKSIALENVSFSYFGGGAQVLSNVNLKIEKGLRVGIIGGSGQGKSTLVDLMLGLLKPSNGNVLIDGVPLRENNVEAWQKTVSSVPQHVFLIDASVKENIAFGVPVNEIDVERVKLAARIAEISEIVEQMPAGFDSKVGERGSRLSGGQRQRIGIARAIYKAGSVLFFDEATSSLDNETERKVMENLHSLLPGVTVIAIAHRLSSLKDFDRIIRLEGGDIEWVGRLSEQQDQG